MGTANILPNQSAEPALDVASQDATLEDALVPLESPVSGSSLVLSHAVARLPVELEVVVPVRGFRVRNLLNLVAGTLVATQWANGDDLPLQAGKVQLAWTEFEVVDARLAVRVTRLA